MRNGGTCVLHDDMADVLKLFQEANVLVLATPVYSWYCTPPMKALLDRCVYAMNKFYGTADKSGTDAQAPASGTAIWAGRKVCLITTCGYPPEKGADLLEEGIRRYCRHSQLEFLGTLVERHTGYGTQFMNGEKEQRARDFAREIVAKM